MAAIFVSKRRIDLSVDSESCLSPSAFGATEVTFRWVYISHLYFIINKRTDSLYMYVFTFIVLY